MNGGAEAVLWYAQAALHPWIPVTSDIEDSMIAAVFCIFY